MAPFCLDQLLAYIISYLFIFYLLNFLFHYDGRRGSELMEKGEKKKRGGGGVNKNEDCEMNRVNG